MGFTRFYWVFTWVLLGFTGIVLEWRRRYGGKPPSFFLPEVLLSVFYRVFTEFLGGRDEVTRRVHRSTRAARVALERPLVRRPPRRPLIESTEAAARRSVFFFFFFFFFTYRHFTFFFISIIFIWEDPPSIVGIVSSTPASVLPTALVITSRFLVSFLFDYYFNK